VAAAYLIDPTLFDHNPVTFTVRDRGWRGGSILDLKSRDSFDEQDGQIPINVPRKLDAERFMQMLIQRLLSL